MPFFLLVMIGWFFVGFVIAAVLGVSWLKSFQWGVLVFLGVLIWVATFILPDDYKRRLFFEGPEEDEEGLLVAALFNALPAGILLWAGLAWLFIKIVALFQ
jgi:hypothetical protein